MGVFLGATGVVQGALVIGGQQVPLRNDRQKSRGNGSFGFVWSHPRQKNKCVPRMGHPRFFGDSWREFCDV